MDVFEPQIIEFYGGDMPRAWAPSCGQISDFYSHKKGEWMEKMISDLKRENEELKIENEKLNLESKKNSKALDSFKEICITDPVSMSNPIRGLDDVYEYIDDLHTELWKVDGSHPGRGSDYIK